MVMACALITVTFTLAFVFSVTVRMAPMAVCNSSQLEVQMSWLLPLSSSASAQYLRVLHRIAPGVHHVRTPGATSGLWLCQ